MTWFSVFFSAAPYYYIPEFITKITRISQLVTVIAVLATLMHCLITKSFRKLSPSVSLVFCFFIWCFISLIWSVKVSETLYFIVVFIEFVILVWLIWENSRTLKQVNYLIWAYILGTIVSGCYILFNFFSANAIIEQAGVTEYERYSTGAINLNDQAAIIVLGIGLALYFIRQKNYYRNYKTRIICLIAIIIGTVGVGLTGSRGGVVCLIFTILFSIFALSMRGRLILILLTLSFIFILPTFSTYLNKFSFVQRIETLNEDALSGHFGNRTIIWLAAKNLIIESPLLGSGAGTFNDAIIPYLGYSKAPHNTFIAVFAQVGLVGFSILLWIIYSLFRACRRHFSREIRNVSYMLLSFWLISSMTLGLDREKITWLVFALVAALLYAPHKEGAYSSELSISNKPENLPPLPLHAPVNGGVK